MVRNIVLEDYYDEYLDELGESALTGYSTAWLFKRADPTAYRIGLNEYTDELEEECRPTPPDFEPCYTEREMEDYYDEMLDEIGTEWLADRYSIAWLIKRADPTAYRVGLNEYEDMVNEDNEAETFAAHETNCDCYQCEKKKWDARSYWEKQILLDDPEQYHRKSRDLGWNETRKCRRCAKWGGEVYGAKVTEYNDGLRLYHYEDCGCGVYDHSIRNRRRKKWRREKSRIRQEEMNALIRKREQENRQREARKKAQKKWWQFWRAEDSDLGQYAAEEESKGRYIPATEGYTKVAHWSVNPIYATKGNTSCRDGCGKRAKYKCLNCDYDWCEDHFGLLSVEWPDEPMCYRCKNDMDESWAEGFDTEYNFVMSDIGEADERVEEKLDEGWKLYGDPVVFEKQDFTVFGQGMTKDAETFHADPLLQAIKDREKARKAGTVKLQGMPRTKGTKAEDVKVGDVLVWNQGGTSQVMSITPKGKQSLLWKTRTEDGREWERTVRKNRLVVVARPNGWIAKKYADMKSESFTSDESPCSRCGKVECNWWYHEVPLKCYFCKKGVGYKGEPLQHDATRERVYHPSCYAKSLGEGRDFHAFRAEEKKTEIDWGIHDNPLKVVELIQDAGFTDDWDLAALGGEGALSSKIGASHPKGVVHACSVCEDMEHTASSCKGIRWEVFSNFEMWYMCDRVLQESIENRTEDMEEVIETAMFNRNRSLDEPKKRAAFDHPIDPVEWIYDVQPMNWEMRHGFDAESQVEMSKPMSFYVGVVAGLGGFLALRSYFQNQE